jgi:hypothetical protein
LDADTPHHGVKIARRITDITVSASRIENFIGVAVGGGGQIPGSSLLAEQNRRLAQIQAEKEQANARGEIFDRLFRGFPAAAMDIRVLNISLSDKDPNVLVLHLRYNFKPTFIGALEGTLKALAVMECAGPSRTIEDWELYPYANGARSLRACASGQSAGSLGFLNDDGSGNGVCLRDSNSIKCYSLAPGNYCASCDLNNFSNFRLTSIPTKRLILFWRFIDNNGQLANKQVACLGSPATQVLQQIFISKPEARPSGFVAGFDLRSGDATIEINSSFVDLSKAKYFVAVAGLSMPSDSWGDGNSFANNRWLTSLVPDSENPAKGGCQLLDQAAQLQLITRDSDISPGNAARSGPGAAAGRSPQSTASDKSCFLFNGKQVCN